MKETIKSFAKEQYQIIQTTMKIFILDEDALIVVSYHYLSNWNDTYKILPRINYDRNQIKMGE